MPKKQGLYSVVDYVNKVTVVPPTVMMNDLTAALSFYQTFGLDRKKGDGKPNFQMLCLYKICDVVEEDEEDEGYVHVEPSQNPIHLTGKIVKDFIQNEYARLGLEDDFIESGTANYRSRFTKSISNTMKYDCQFHQLVPILKRFCIAGDVWKIGGDVLVRFQPMVSPSLTPNSFKVRYFFVPLRLIEPNTELIITGSKDGKLNTGTLPKFKNFTDDVDKQVFANGYVVPKHGFWDYMAVQPGNYESLKDDECLPAQYWFTAYSRIFWDYYRDENLNSNTDFTQFISYLNKSCPNNPLFYSKIKKDYFSSCLPWQLKGTAPSIAVNGTGQFSPNFRFLYNEATVPNASPLTPVEIKGNVANGDFDTMTQPFTVPLGATEDERTNFATRLANLLNSAEQQNVAISGLGFTADDLRTMMPQTRIFERLARCGSRYTEYLYSNFGTAPADETLQRAQYLGGWSIPILTTEVLQTAEDGSTPVGTMRGHGITRGGNSIKTFHCKEFGLLFGLAEIRPNIEYTTGIPRQLTYKRRFDFFNPSLQHLSEQEVRNGEIFIGTDGKNDDTFGFQAYGNELRTAVDETVGDLRDSLSYWTQSLHFTTRPNLNNAFISGQSHHASFNAPFAVNGVNAYPCIVMFHNNLDVYRPMVRYSTPGLVDHL